MLALEGSVRKNIVIDTKTRDNDPIFFFGGGGVTMNENRQQQLLNREVGND